MNNYRKETANGPLKDSLLQLGGEVGLDIKDGAKANMSLDLRRT
jgi:hypothetical protein